MQSVFTRTAHLGWTGHIQVLDSHVGEWPPTWTGQRKDLSEGEQGETVGTRGRGCGLHFKQLEEAAG